MEPLYNALLGYLWVVVEVCKGQKQVFKASLVFPIVCPVINHDKSCSEATTCLTNLSTGLLQNPPCYSIFLILHEEYDISSFQHNFATTYFSAGFIVLPQKKEGEPQQLFMWTTPSRVQLGFPGHSQNEYITPF